MTSVHVHQSVLGETSAQWLITVPDGVYVDGTFGRGGHARLLLERLGPAGRVIGIDKDPQAVAEGESLAQKDNRFTMMWSSFADIADLCAQCGVEGVDGIFLDLGVSSPQLDDAERGFSFSHDGPLDMRMNPQAGFSAAEWVNTVSEKDMVQVFFDYGEEKFARRMAGAIVRRRTEKPFERTLDLAEVVKAANPRWEKHKHPATRVFQAIRIHINAELEDLKAVLHASTGLLRPGGRLVVISFHSLEDRLVKRFMRDQAQGRKIPKGVPVREEDLERQFKLLVKGYKADQTEVDDNVRARSAVLRVAERLPKPERAS